ncbi:hypothetical protein QQ008_03505 [Fulvivirgaceae bacterium BMA10]|uniref:Actin-binding WH2 domain-containing protein n=1 Tax=Splendidivirga corallicola TaxID=3051826 RepID=A0ABT8KI83_9BACT|nr:hypothetical protein [Fulvivirgaceae bacterium BMA10]
MSKIPFQEAFDVLQDREKHFQRITERNYSPNIIWAQVILMCIFTFCYGIIMGSYNSFQQALVTGVKLWLLFSLTLIICFPSFYIVQLILGSKIKIKQLFVILMGGFLMTTTIMLAFAPIVLYFQLSGDNYNFLQLLHVFVFMFAGFFGMRVVLESLKGAFEGTKVYPKIGLSVFRIWVVIFAFVGIQLSWNLRPFLGSKDMPFQLFRESTRGNFYSTTLGSIGKLLGVQKNEQKKDERKQVPEIEPINGDNKEKKPDEKDHNETALNELDDANSKGEEIIVKQND